MDLFTLSAKLQLDKSDYDKGLADSESLASKFGQGLTQTFGAVGKAAAVGVAAVGAATTAAGAALVKNAGEVAAYGDNIDKMSQKMGISAEAYQEWDAILQHSGTSIDSMSRGMQTLQKNAVNSAEKFEKLGLTQEQIASMSTEDLFAATIQGLQNMGEGAERTALASELLGGSAKELGALLNTSAEDTEAMRQRVHELGGVMSDEAVKSAAAYQDSLQDMQTSMAGLKRNLVSEFLPSITTAMDGLTAIFSGDYDEGLSKISEGIEGLVDGIANKLPQIVEIGGQIIETLAVAIIDNLPTLFEAGMKLVLDLGFAIIDNLPRLIEVALTLVQTLAQGLIEALPELIPAIVDMITEIVTILTEPDTLVQLVMAAVQIILAVAQGLVEAIPQLIEAVPVIIGNLVIAFIQLAPQLLEAGIQLIMTLIEGIKSVYSTIFTIAGELIGKVLEGIKAKFDELKRKGGEVVDKVKAGLMEKIDAAKQWGKDLIQNFIDGLLEKWNALKETVGNIASSIKDFLGFSEPKLGALSDFHTYAPDMMELFMKGIEDNKPKLLDTVADAFDFQNLIKAPHPSGDAEILRALGDIKSAVGGTKVEVVLEGDADRLFRVMQRESRRNNQITGQPSFA